MKGRIIKEGHFNFTLAIGVIAIIVCCTLLLQITISYIKAQENNKVENADTSHIESAAEDTSEKQKNTITEDTKEYIRLYKMEDEVNIKRDEAVNIFKNMMIQVYEVQPDEINIEWDKSVSIDKAAEGLYWSFYYTDSTRQLAYWSIIRANTGYASYMLCYNYNGLNSPEEAARLRRDLNEEVTEEKQSLIELYGDRVKELVVRANLKDGKTNSIENIDVSSIIGTNGGKIIEFIVTFKDHQRVKVVFYGETGELMGFSDF